MPIKISGTTLYTVQEIADKLAVTTVTIRNYIIRGSLKGKKVFGRWLFTEEQVKQFFDSLN
jgi:excisionase family DNA binding protein